MGFIRLTFWALALLMTISCASGNKRDVERAQLHLQIGTSHLARGSYPAALRELLIAEKYDSRSPVIQNHLGLAYYFRGRPDLAKTHLHQALSLDKNYTEARNNLGRLLIDDKSYDEAISHLKVAVEDLVYPHPERPLTNLGIAYFYKAQWSLAHNALLQSLRIRRNDCTTLSYYGRTLHELGRFQQATEALDQAITQCKDTNFDEPLYYSALSYVKLHKQDHAKARLNEILTLFPSGHYAVQAKKLLETLK